MGTKKTVVKKAGKKAVTSKPSTGFAWKMQAEAIAGLDKRVEDNEADIKSVAQYAEQVNGLRKKMTSRLHSDILETERRQDYLHDLVRGNMFWMTMLGLTMAALNMAMLHLLVN